MLSDQITDDNMAFMGQGISPGGATGNVQLWNPYATGKVLYIDALTIAVEVGGNVWGDLRATKAPLAALYPGHQRNKNIDSEVLPAAEIRVAYGDILMDYPYNRPFHEFWVNATRDDRTYRFDPPIRIPQGRGVAALMDGNTTIASFQWREKADPLGVVEAPPPTPGLIAGGAGTISADLANSAYVFDSDDMTYGNDAATTGFYVGKIWAAPTAISRIVLKSPPGRAFSGANPGRTYSCSLETFNGTTWAMHMITNYTEPGTGATQSVIDWNLSSPVAALGHRLRMTNSAAAAHRVGCMEFYI